MMQTTDTEAKVMTSSRESSTVAVRLTGETLQTIEQAAKRRELSLGLYLREAGYAAASRRRRPRRRRQGRMARAKIQPGPQPKAAAIDTDAVATAVAGKLRHSVADWMPDHDGYSRWDDNPLVSFAMMFVPALIGGLTGGAAVLILT